MILGVQLAALDRDLAEAERHAKAALATVRALRKAAALGTIGAFDKSFDQAPRQIEQLNAALAAARTGFAYDVEAAMESGAYTAELRAATDAAGVVLIERDGRLSAFPLLLKLEPRAAAVRIGAKLNRNLNPAVVAAVLRKAQATQTFRPTQVLETVFAAYRHIAPGLQPGWRDTTAGVGPVVPLLDLHDALTVLPEAAAAYSREAFACDLLRLNRAPDTTTRGGHGFALAAATATKGRNMLRVYDEAGVETVFAGISFTRAAAP